jgi:hypothetical protein
MGKERGEAAASRADGCANELRDRGTLNEEECFIDATFVMAKGGGLEIEATKRGKGMKIMAIGSRNIAAPNALRDGSPLAC